MSLEKAENDPLQPKDIGPDSAAVDEAKADGAAAQKDAADGDDEAKPADDAK